MSDLTKSENDTSEHRHPTPVTIKVNNRAVTLPDSKTTGLAIKEMAIQQGLPIQVGFVLFRMTGHQQHPVRDNDILTVHDDEQFRCLDTDDNS